MRAIYVENIENNSFEIGADYCAINENAHHLLNVIRIQKNEKVLIMNGRGLKILCEFIKADKKKARLKILKIDFLKKKSFVDLALCVPQKGSLEEVIRLSVEVGINNIYPIMSSYAQSYEFNNTRIDKIICNSMIQSNNFWKLNIENKITFSDLGNIFQNYEQTVYFTGQSSNKQDELDCSCFNNLIFIGPEGGLSEFEENFLLDCPNIKKINLSMPILRSKTAVGVAMGYLHGCFFKASKTY